MNNILDTKLISMIIFKLFMSILTKLEDVLNKETEIVSKEIEFACVYTGSDFWEDSYNRYGFRRPYDGFGKKKPYIHTDLTFHVAPKEPLYFLDSSSVSTLNRVASRIIIRIGANNVSNVSKAELEEHGFQERDPRTQIWMMSPAITFFEHIGMGEINYRFSLNPEFEQETRELQELSETKEIDFRHNSKNKFEVLRRIEVRIYPSAEYFKKASKIAINDFCTMPSERFAEEHLNIGSSANLIGGKYWLLRVLPLPYNEYFKKFNNSI